MGFTAGSNQSFEKPFGDNFDSDLLDRWIFAEPEKHKHKKEIDAILDAGAFIIGNNMFGPKDKRDNPARRELVFTFHEIIVFIKAVMIRELLLSGYNLVPVRR